MVDLLERLRNRIRSNASAARAQRLLLHWWRATPVRCATCYDGRGAVTLGTCRGCGRIYFIKP
jgi:hypothetical protein